MKPEPLNGKTFTTLKIKSLKPGSLADHHRFLSDKWVRVSDLESACEFYLRYKNNPEGLFTKYRNYTKLFELYLMSTHNFSYVFWLKRYFLSRSIKKKWMALDEYNEWLFKLAFKDVLDGGDKK